MLTQTFMLCAVMSAGASGFSTMVAGVGATQAASLLSPGSAPSAVVDLTTVQGAAMVGARWSTRPVRLRTVEASGDVASGRSAAPAGEALDYEPRPGAWGPDALWQSITPEQLSDRRGAGRISFQWYRLNFTIPHRFGGIETSGATVVLRTRVDDAAEVWVNGSLSKRLGQSGGGVAAGYNAPNVVAVVQNAQPGDGVDVAIFAANGPISEAPENFIWVREARLEFYTQPRGVTPTPVQAELARFDAALDDVIAPGAQVERIAEGFRFTEGPVWVRRAACLLFSDPNSNTIYRWTPDGQVSIFMSGSGYTGADVAEYRQPGSNGLTIDDEGRLVFCRHGDRRIARLEPDGSLTTLADRFEGGRLNSPNDLVYSLDGSLYFTDPDFGLPKFSDDRRKELQFAGVYRLKDGRLTLLTTEMTGPNGIALSHKQTHLFVGDWDESHKVVMRYPLLADGSLGKGEVFADLTAEEGAEAIDGVKVDDRGNVFICGPGGLWIYSAEGKRLGLLRNVESPHNIAFGDLDGRTLYMTAHTGVYRVRLVTAGPVP